MQELSLGESLTLAFSLYYNNFIILVIPYLAVAFLSGLLFGMVLGQANAIPPMSSNPTPDQLLGWFTTYWVPFIAAILGIGIFIGIVGQIVGGMIIKCTSDLIEKGSASLGHAFQFTLGRILRLIAASIIVSLAGGLGALCIDNPWHYPFLDLHPSLSSNNDRERRRLWQSLPEHKTCGRPMAEDLRIYGNNSPAGGDSLPSAERGSLPACCLKLRCILFIILRPRRACYPADDHRNDRLLLFHGCERGKGSGTSGTTCGSCHRAQSPSTSMTAIKFS